MRTLSLLPIAIVLLLQLATRTAYAQTMPSKPVGTVDILADCTAGTKPSWLTFGLLSESDDFAAAAACSQATGMKWVLGFYGQSPVVNVTTAATAARTRASQTGLLPHLSAVQFSEEWYGRFKSGEFAAYGLDHTTPAGIQAGIAIVRDVIGARQGELKAVFNLPVTLLETFINTSLIYGPGYWQPVPPNTDILVLDAYVPQGGTFTTGPLGTIPPQLAFETAVAQTTLPIVIMPQWFYVPGGPWPVPTQDTIVRYTGWLSHPRVIGMWGFTWRSRNSVPAPDGPIIGIKDMPQQLAWLKQSLGVQ